MSSDLEWIVFDVDGVLVDVSSSFDRVVKKTVSRLSEKRIELELEDIRKVRKRGAFGDDFKLCHAFLIAGDELIDLLPKGEGLEWTKKRFDDELPTGQEELKKVFNTFYLGEKYEDYIFNARGLWREESSLVEKPMLERADEGFELGVITGRSELEMDLAEMIIGYEFDNRMTREDHLKPDPRALKKLVGERSGIFIGDTNVDRRLVENYNTRYSEEFDFLMVGDDVKDVNEAIECLLAE